MAKQKEKTNDSNLKLSLLITFGVLSIIWILIGLNKFEINEKYISDNFIFNTDIFYNNTGQTLQYISTLIGFTIFFPIIYYLIKTKLSTINNKCINKMFDMFILLLIIFSVGIGGSSLFSSILLVIVAILIYYLIYKKYDIFNSIVIKKQNILILILSIFTSILYIDKSYQQSFFLMHHVTAYYYPIHKILNGLTPYIDFNSLYGGYSYVYAAILNFFPQNMHLLVFSIITSILIFASLMLTYRFLKSFIKEKNNIIFVFLSFLFCNIYLIYVVENSTYIQYMPHRYLSMAIMMNYILYILKNNTIKRIILGYLSCALMMFWNFDSGFIITIAYTIFIIYNQLYNKEYKRIFITLLLLIISVIIPFIIIGLLTYSRVGYLPNIKDILFSTILFSNSGFLSLKLEYTSAPWIIVLISYLIFFGKSLVSLYDKNENMGKTCFLSILGLGIFIYYIERSVIIKFVFIIVPLLFLIQNTDNKKSKIICIITNLSLSTICTLCIIFSIIIKLFFQNYNMQSETLELKIPYNNLLSFSDKIGKENFEMYINCDIIYYELLDKKDMKRLPSYLDLFKKEDLEKLIEYIEQSDKSIVVSLELVTQQHKYFFTNSIKKKYYIYYKYNEKNQDNYVFFIKKEDINKITDIDDYEKIKNLKIEEING